MHDTTPNTESQAPERLLSDPAVSLEAGLSTSALPDTKAIVSQRKLQTLANSSPQVRQLQALQALADSKPMDPVIQMVALPAVARTALPSAHAVAAKHWDPDPFEYASDKNVRRLANGDTLFPKEFCGGNQSNTAWGFYNRVSASAAWVAQPNNRYVHHDWDDDEKVKVVIAHDAAQGKQTLVTVYPTEGRNLRATWRQADETAEKNLYHNLKIKRDVRANKKVAQRDALVAWAAALTGDGTPTNAAALAPTVAQGKATVVLHYADRAAAELALTHINANLPAFGIEKFYTTAT